MFKLLSSPQDLHFNFAVNFIQKKKRGSVAVTLPRSGVSPKAGCAKPNNIIQLYKGVVPQR